MKRSGADSPIGKGTSFVICDNDRFFLITNWHCVTGRNCETKEPINSNGIADPEILTAYFHSETLGQWIIIDIELFTSTGDKIWIEHKLGERIDVVAIPLDIKLEKFNGIFFYYIDLEKDNADLKIYPSIELSIIGFPKAYTGGGKFPIWKKGHLASEYDIDWNGLPLVLIDATTRSGMSGSPVIIKQAGMCTFSNGGVAQGEFVKFLGIYSGRIDNDIEIGKVWKPIVIKEIIK
ncbi:MAG: hypothetical protein CVT96_03430 [Bacteroidetes bacterium HGW-Bacteroidetes-13]|nr:MAG: hypothetical protein CVT96_03430 [Bacteroidetes bacterium HGW-Bacteroidetes-13]